MSTAETANELVCPDCGGAEWVQHSEDGYSWCLECQDWVKPCSEHDYLWENDEDYRRITSAICERCGKECHEDDIEDNGCTSCQGQAFWN